MTSRSIDGDCYVYITLPGSTSPVTAGRYRLEVDPALGIHRGRFVYGRSYLARPDAVELDPIELRLAEPPYTTVRLKGVFGSIRDASPDYWGRRVIEKHSGIGQPSELDFLLMSPEDRAGALGFGRNVEPPAPLTRFNRTVNLAALQAAADAIVADEEVPTSSADAASQIGDLLLIGTAMGGARPKTVVEDEESLWIAKFNRSDDRFNNARVERAMLELARRAGLTVADSRIADVGGRDVLLVKRFDRQKEGDAWRRARMVSAFTLLQADEGAVDRHLWSYVLLAEQLRRISAAPSDDARELFRRMCFNALISNTDDHPRNHAVIAWGKDWQISPAYDLTPSTPISLDRRDLAMECGDIGRIANAMNLVSQSRRFTLDPGDATRIVDDMQRIVASEWYPVARGEGVSEQDCERIRGAFVYPGFARETIEDDAEPASRASAALSL